jgi:hypothetical protein
LKGFEKKSGKSVYGKSIINLKFSPVSALLFVFLFFFVYTLPRYTAIIVSLELRAAGSKLNILKPIGILDYFGCMEKKR